MFQICQCGTQPGYPHDPRCPFPLFTDDGESVERWNRERAELELEAGVEMPEPLLSRAFRIENGDGLVVARCIVNGAGETGWSVVFPSLMASPDATIADVWAAVGRGDLVAVELVEEPA